MKHFFKGAVVMVAVSAVNMIINIICNVNGVDLDSVSTGTMSAVCAMLLYQGWVKRETNKEA